MIVDAKLVDDKISAKIARDIAKKIENEMQYPGEIKVTVMREIAHGGVCAVRRPRRARRQVRASAHTARPDNYRGGGPLRAGRVPSARGVAVALIVALCSGGSGARSRIGSSAGECHAAAAPMAHTEARRRSQ